MTLSGYIYITICSLTVTAANVLLREGLRNHGIVIFENGIQGVFGDLLKVLLSPILLVSLFFYFVSMLIWFRLVVTQPLSLAYPILTTLTFIGVALTGILFFQEPLSFLKIIGLCLALSGCLVLVLSAAS